MFDTPDNTFRVTPGYEFVVRAARVDAAGVFGDPRVVCWRTLPDRENCTLDVDLGDGRRGRLHVKRYRPSRGSTTPADEEVQGHQLLVDWSVPTAPLVAWGNLPDRRSFTVWQDLEGYT